jgi:succinate dehydrogenase/fumarate reductase flavoprotein subunit
MTRAQAYDVIVIGGGAAGTAAAIGASSAGAEALLVESAPFLGGAATLKSVLTYCGLFTNHEKKQAVFGVADQVLQEFEGWEQFRSLSSFTEWQFSLNLSR